MHKKLILLVSLLALTLISIPVLSAKPVNKSATNGLDKGANDHLYLFEKDEGTWEVIEDGAWAKMNINLKQLKFVFNGHGLVSEQEYTLICYVDPWPGDGSKVLGTGTADEQGNIHIKGPIDYTELHDINPEDYDGSKIWLVPSADFDETEQKMIAWTPEQILFEFDLLNTLPAE